MVSIIGDLRSKHWFIFTICDLKATGIDVWDESGRKVDFHALRHTFITNAQKTGLPSRTIQEAARHLSPELTNKAYTDTSKLETNQAIDALPSFLRRTTGVPKA